MLSKMERDLDNVFLSATIWKEPNSTPRTAPGFLFINLLNLLASATLRLFSQESVEDGAGCHRLIKYLQHSATDVEKSKLLQEVESTLLVNGSRSFSTVQFIVQVDTQVLIFLHLFLGWKGEYQDFRSPEVHQEPLSFAGVELCTCSDISYHKVAIFPS